MICMCWEMQFFLEKMPLELKKKLQIKKEMDALVAVKLTGSLDQLICGIWLYFYEYCKLSSYCSVYYSTYTTLKIVKPDNVAVIDNIILAYMFWHVAPN